MELAIVKTVAGFMNASGGTLLIGVNDNGEIVGLHQDLKSIGRRDHDGYENWLTTLLVEMIGLAATANVSIRLEEVRREAVCRLDVRPSKKPVFVGSGKRDVDFYVRLNNSTRRLDTREALAYVQVHWD